MTMMNGFRRRMMCVMSRFRRSRQWRRLHNNTIINHIINIHQYININVIYRTGLVRRTDADRAQPGTRSVTFTRTLSHPAPCAYNHYNYHFIFYIFLFLLIDCYSFKTYSIHQINTHVFASQFNFLFEFVFSLYFRH